MSRSHSCSRNEYGVEHTSCLPRANSSVTWTTRVATNISDLGIQQSLAFKCLAEEVLDAPEAAGGDGAFLGIGWEVGGGAAFGVEGDAGGGREGAEKAGEEVGHCRSHDEYEDRDEEGCYGLQFER